MRQIYARVAFKTATLFYIACKPFIKHCERFQKFRETGNFKTFIEHLYRNELDKVCFIPDAAYSDKKNLAEGTISDKILKIRAYEIARNCTYDGYQRALANMVYKPFDKNTESEESVYEQVAEELHKPVNKKFKRRKVYTRIKQNILAADLAEKGSVS